MNPRNEYPYLLLIWNSSQLYIIGRKSIPDRFVFTENGIEMNAAVGVSDPSFTGFVDYLRDGVSVIGCRMWYFGEWSSVCQSSPWAPFIIADNDAGSLSVFWDSATDFIEDDSGDQEFGCNRIYLCNDRSYFGLSLRWHDDIDFGNVDLHRNTTILL